MVLTSRQTFEKKFRLTLARDFKNVRAQGKKKTVYPFIIYQLKNPYDYPRVGITITSKAGNSVVRNKVKRRLREFFRQNKDLFGTMDTLFFTAKPLKKITKLKWQQIIHQVKGALG